MKSVPRMVAVLLLLVGVFGGICDAGTSSVHRNRITSLDDLKEIDNYVATGLPLFDHGFFVGTSNGPILVKAKEEGPNKNKPRLNPGYYSTLPRLIPAGYEGISISHFNLGSAIPAQTPSIFAHPSFLEHGIFTQTRPLGTRYQNQHQHHQPLPSPVVPEPVTFNNPPPISQYGFRTNQRHDRFLHQTHPSPYHNYHHQPQQHQVVQNSFQHSNFLSEDDHVPTSYQRMTIGHDHHDEQRGHNNLLRNPTVQQTLDYEENLPEDLKNPFYKNAALASALAQESLPIEGETIVGEWDTTKIQKRRINDLLQSAGFLR